MNTHSYDILANPHYVEEFQYISPSIENRDKMIIDSDSEEGNDSAQSDLVRICLNLAFLQEKEGREFQYDKDVLSSVAQERLASSRKVESGN